MLSLAIGILVLLVSVGIAFVGIWITVNPIPPDRPSLKRKYVWCIVVLAVVLGICQIIQQQHEKIRADREHADEVTILTEKLGRLEGINTSIQRQVDQIPDWLSILFKNPELSKDEIIRIMKSSMPSTPHAESQPEQANIDPYGGDNESLLSELGYAISMLKFIAGKYPDYSQALARFQMPTTPNDQVSAEQARQSIMNNMAEVQSRYPDARSRAVNCMRGIRVRMKKELPQPIPRILQEGGDKIAFDISSNRACNHLS